MITDKHLLLNCLRKLVKQHRDSLTRCKNCYNSQPFFLCDDCKSDIEQFMSTIVDILNTSDMEGPEKILFAMSCIGDKA